MSAIPCLTNRLGAQGHLLSVASSGRINLGNFQGGVDFFPLINAEKSVLLVTHACYTTNTGSDLSLLQMAPLKAFVLCFSFVTSVSVFCLL